MFKRIVMDEVHVSWKADVVSKVVQELEGGFGRYSFLRRILHYLYIFHGHIQSLHHTGDGDEDDPDLDDCRRRRRYGGGPTSCSRICVLRGHSCGDDEIGGRSE